MMVKEMRLDLFLLLFPERFVQPVVELNGAPCGMAECGDVVEIVTSRRLGKSVNLCFSLAVRYTAEKC